MRGEKGRDVICSACGRTVKGWPLEVREGFSVMPHKSLDSRQCPGRYRSNHRPANTEGVGR